MKIEITNWDKYNPRHDVKSTSWFRLENTFWIDPLLTPLDCEGKMVWLVLLALASKEQSACFELDKQFIVSAIKVSETKFDETLRYLQDRDKIKIPTLRTRNARVTRTSRPRDATDGRTDGTDVTDVVNGAVAPPPDGNLPAVVSKKRAPKATPEGAQVWDAYRAAYLERYGQEPVRNTKANSQCKNLVARLGVEAAVNVVRFYLTHQKNFYIQTVHALGPCLQDCEGLHTQMLAGHRVSSSEAAHKDRQQSNVQAFSAAYQNLVAKGVIKHDT